MYGDSGYNQIVYLQVPFKGSALDAEQRAFNLAISTERITVEWFFKELKLYWIRRTFLASCAY